MCSSFYLRQWSKTSGNLSNKWTGVNVSILNCESGGMFRMLNLLWRIDIDILCIFTSPVDESCTLLDLNDRCILTWIVQCTKKPKDKSHNSHGFWQTLRTKLQVDGFWRNATHMNFIYASHSFHLIKRYFIYKVYTSMLANNFYTWSMDKMENMALRTMDDQNAEWDIWRKKLNPIMWM